MKIFFFITLIIIALNAQGGMKNIVLNTLDKDEVLQKVSLRVEKIKFNKLVKNDYTTHQKNIDTLKENIFITVNLKEKMRDIQLTLNDYKDEYNTHKKSYQRKIDKIYRNSKNLKRVTYYLVSHKIDEDYIFELQNYLLDKYAITKFEQTLVMKESTNNIESFKSVIKTKKVFGQMRLETLNDFSFREKNLNFKLLKVTQIPFSKKGSSNFSQSIERDVDRFAEDSSVKVYQIDTDKTYQIFISHYKIDDKEKENISLQIKKMVNIKKNRKRIKSKTAKIVKTIKKIETTHNTQMKISNKHSAKIATVLQELEKQEQKLQKLFTTIKDTAKKYKIDIKLEELDKLIIVTPKLYSEYVELGEEKEYIVRKTKSYLSKITVNDITQSETLTNYYDLQTKNSDTQKMIGYESIHILPFVKGKELGLFIFSTIEIEEKITQSNYVKKEFKYGTMEFVPVKRAYRTIFASSTELTLGLIKEFVQTNKQNKYFDEYCLEDSFLPEDAKFFKDLDEEYYDYPAVCFKMEKIEKVIAWFSKKVGKKLVVPTNDDWSYIASNSNSSDYCWGNQEIDELNEDEVKPENIYYEDDMDTTIEEVKTHTASILGMYDMCGNVHEMVLDDDIYAIKGNSFISYIEKSDAPAMEFDEELTPSLGLRLFYIMESK